MWSLNSPNLALTFSYSPVDDFSSVDPSSTVGISKDLRPLTCARLVGLFYEVINLGAFDDVLYYI